MVARNDIHWRLLTDRSGFLDHVIQTLGEWIGQENYLSKREIHWQTSAGVIMLLGDRPAGPDKRTEPCLVLNKRSLRVRQPGDLCFPGGSMAPLIDPCLAPLFSLPFSSLGRWPYWKNWRQSHRRPAKSMSILWATGLRESLEEMRLNPFGVRFLGPLPPRSLVMFKRTIYPMVGWINRQKRFFPNWEVEKVVRLPLKSKRPPQSEILQPLSTPDRKRCGPGTSRIDSGLPLFPVAGTRQPGNPVGCDLPHNPRLPPTRLRVRTTRARDPAGCGRSA